MQEVIDEREDEEVESNGRFKVEGEPHTSCVDEMTCATPLSHAMQCVNHDDKNLANKQENCAHHVSVFMCAVLKVLWVLVVTLSLVSCSETPQTQYQVQISFLLDFVVHFCTCSQIVFCDRQFICSQIVAHFCIAKTGHLRCCLHTLRRLQ